MREPLLYAMESMALSFFMDYLIHDVESENWREEVETLVCITPNGSIDMSVLAFDACLENPELSKWRDALAWRLIDQYGKDACVIQKQQVNQIIAN